MWPRDWLIRISTMRWCEVAVAHYSSTHPYEECYIPGRHFVIRIHALSPIHKREKL
ncbi:hypothetical protein GBAR_LOCUS26482 [Geodia barretti]|uniref:Uncharacterized protein n=1 Tax=Geodia barretti TaxID=519541 RepID=A0AA35TH60_GEOBA|nr:hypothetical protein GBAR_LOCUS26482 [Geodia barretti]